MAEADALDAGIAISELDDATAIEILCEGRVAVMVEGEMTVSDSYTIFESYWVGSVCEVACVT